MAPPPQSVFGTLPNGGASGSSQPSKPLKRMQTTLEALYERNQRNSNASSGQQFLFTSSVHKSSSSRGRNPASRQQGNNTSVQSSNPSCSLSQLFQDGHERLRNRNYLANDLHVQNVIAEGLAKFSQDVRDSTRLGGGAGSGAGSVPLGVGAGSGLASNKSKLHRLLQDSRTDYQDRELSGLQLLQQIDFDAPHQLEQDGTYPGQEHDELQFQTKGSARGGTASSRFDLLHDDVLEDEATEGTGRGPVVAQSFLNELHNTLTSSIEESMKDSFYKANAKSSAKLNYQWNTMKKKIIEQIRAGNDLGTDFLLNLSGGAPAVGNQASRQKGVVLSGGGTSANGGAGRSSALLVQPNTTGNLHQNLQIERDIAELFNRSSFMTIDRLAFEVYSLSLQSYSGSEYCSDLKFLWELVLALVGQDPMTITAPLLVDRGIEFLRMWKISEIRDSCKQMPRTAEQDICSLLINYGMIIWDDAHFPSTAGHAWFLVFHALRVDSPEMLRYLQSEARLRQCFANAAEFDLCVQTCIPVLISLLQGTSVSLEHSVVATIESALGSGIHRMWGNEAGNATSGHHQQHYGAGYNPGGQPQMSTTNRSQQSQNGAVFRELCLKLILGEDFPFEDTSLTLQEEQYHIPNFSNHPRDMFSERMRTSENLVWHNLLLVKNKRCSLEEYQEKIMSIIEWTDARKSGGSILGGFGSSNLNMMSFFQQGSRFGGANMGLLSGGTSGADVANFLNTTKQSQFQLDDIKLLFLSLQYAKGLRALKNRNPALLSSITIHLAVTLAKAHVLDFDKEKYPYVDEIVNYSNQLFDVSEQLNYIQILQPFDRKYAYLRILKSFTQSNAEVVTSTAPGSGGVGAASTGISNMLVPDHDNNFSPLELLTGKILLDGSHTKGLLQESLEAKVDHLNRKREMKMKGNNSSGSSSNGAGELLMNNKISSSNDTTSEFRSIMESLGLDALRRGKYILALRFLHLSTNYRKVLETMQRILRLPAFTEVASCGSRNLSSGATFTPGQEPIGGGGAGGGATSTSMSGGAASTTAWTNSFKLRQLEQECRKFLSMYADYGASFGIDVNSSNNSGMVVTNAADHGTRAAQQTTRSSDEITRVWRFVCKLWRLKHFHDCVRDQGRYEEALELFDREEFLSNPDEQMLPGFFSVDYTKILETYISLLTRYYAADHFGNTAGGGMLQDQLLPGSSGSQILRQRLLQVQNFLSKNGHISVSPNARYFMQQLSLK